MSQKPAAIPRRRIARSRKPEQNQGISIIGITECRVHLHSAMNAADRSSTDPA
jgi:hypothetical protein